MSDAVVESAKCPDAGPAVPMDQSLLKNVLAILEFYFSDINLSRNKFLAHKVLEDPYVPISLLMGFNKLKEITDDEKAVLEAIKLSKMLHVSEDGKKVFRTTEIQPVDQIDEHVIYVENVPANKDHEWLNQIFSTYGTVFYVSLPVFKMSRENKGFAFVEFSSEKEAVKAFEAFQSAGLNVSFDTAPDELLSIKTHEEPTSEVASDVNRKDLVNSVVETRDLSQLGMKIMLKKDWKRLRNRFLNQMHHKNKQSKAEENPEDEKEDSSKFKEGLVVKLEKEKHQGNLEEYLMGVRMRPNGGVVYVTNKKNDKFVFIRFNSAEKAQDFLSPDFPYITKLTSEEEEKYWEQVAKYVAAKQQRKINQRYERKMEKKRALRAQRAADYNNGWQGEEEEDGSVSFDSLLEQKHAGQNGEKRDMHVNPNMRSKRKKQRDRRSDARPKNKHIYFKDDDDEVPEPKAQEMECSQDLKREAEPSADEPAAKKANVMESSEV